MRMNYAQYADHIYQNKGDVVLKKGNTRWEEYGALRIEPDPNHKPYVEDLEDIAEAMWNPNIGVKLVSQYMMEAYEALGQLDDLQGETDRLRQRLVQVEGELKDCSPEKVARLEMANNDFTENAERDRKALGLAQNLIEDRVREYAFLEEEHKRVKDTITGTIDDVVGVMAVHVQALDHHMREAGMRDVDDVWVEEGKLLVMNMNNEMQKLKEKVE